MPTDRRGNARNTPAILTALAIYSLTIPIQENSWGSQASSETDRQNALLQKAVYAYLDKCVKQTYSQAQLELTELGAEEKLKRKAEWKVEKYDVDSNGKRTETKQTKTGDGPP